MKKTMRGLLAVPVIVLLLAAGYIGLAVYYQDEFAVNTWINGVYCTGSTVQEVNGALLEQTAAPAEFTVVGYDRPGSQARETEWTVSMDDIHRTLDYETGLNEYLAEQNSWLWPDNVIFHREHRLEAEVSIDEAALQDWWEQIAGGFCGDEDYRIEYREESGYTLYDGMHNRLDAAKAYTAVKEALLAGESGVNLIESECYYDVPLTGAQEEQARLWDKIEDFQGNGPVYDFGDGAEPLGRAQMSAFLVKDEFTQMPVTDEAGRFVLAEDCAQEWVKEMALLHDTYQKEWQFQSTRGDIVTVQGVTYGTTINQKRESIWLSGYLERLIEGPDAVDGPGGHAESKHTDGPGTGQKEGLETGQEEGLAAGQENTAYEDVPGVEIHIPAYTRDAYNRSSTQLGDTYIEVDMGVQKLYYYEKGVLKLETEVVTGNARRRMSTPEGVNYVYNKQKNRILRGQGYASPVKFWMPVKGAIGIHDANWRDEFGGDIYKTGGSHGCINVEPDVMAELYDMVEIGTPVVMFYGEKSEEAETAPQTK